MIGTTYTEPIATADLLNSLLSTLERIALALKQRNPDSFTEQHEPPAVVAYRWQSVPGVQAMRRLHPVINPQLVRFADLRNVDSQRQALGCNTAQFVHGYPPAQLPP